MGRRIRLQGHCLRKVLDFKEWDAGHGGHWREYQYMGMEVGLGDVSTSTVTSLFTVSGLAIFLRGVKSSIQATDNELQNSVASSLFSATNPHQLTS